MPIAYRKHYRWLRRNSVPTVVSYYPYVYPYQGDAGIVYHDGNSKAVSESETVSINGPLGLSINVSKTSAHSKTTTNADSSSTVSEC